MKVENEFDSHFRRVLVTARRARQLQNGSQPLVSTLSAKASKIAQQEIDAGLVAHVRQDTPILKPEIDADWFWASQTSSHLDLVNRTR